MNENPTYTAVLLRSPGGTTGEEVPFVPFGANGLPQRTYGQTTILANGNQLEETFELEGPEEAGATHYSYRRVTFEEIGSEETEF
ncbi:hypothetical protein [Leifsonia sp. NPDC058248]|uniref:hypothetical protein n=1 Tax=Leifsonia sp. NPDC058248 TaxID=3346402 RepID=UPI0036D912E8